MSEKLLDETAKDAYLRYIRGQWELLRGRDQPPKSLDEWQTRRTEILAAFEKAFGPRPRESEMTPQVLGRIEREGIAIERIIFQTRPGVWMTANAYIPDRTGPRPTLLAVHGHWPWARMDPVVQARCIGPALLGYFVLSVDAFGAGERAATPAKGTYHGSLTGATLWPPGVPLSGVQVYDNMRAIDYLLTRPEVDGDKLAVTGASGGGNQSMYIGALDERLKAVVPVCSVGTYESYLGQASCVCEVVPGMHRATEEAGVLSLVAPRALMVVNATRDAIQFSVEKAEISIAAAREVFRLYDADAKLKHAVFDSGHDYNRDMRQTLYGWLAQWLLGEGDGSLIEEPPFETEEIDSIRCFTSSVRPEPFHTLPTFAKEQAGERLAAIGKPDHAPMWEAQVASMRYLLREEVLGGFPSTPAASLKELGNVDEDGRTLARFIHEPEPGMPVPVLIASQTATDAEGTTILLHLEGKDAALADPRTAELLAARRQVVLLDLRATGETQPDGDAIAGATDHNSSEWALWLGRPKLGHWVWDVLSLIDHLTKVSAKGQGIAIEAIGHAGVVAIVAAALDERIQSVACRGVLASYVTGVPYVGVPMGILAPGILKAGDIPHLAALSAPRPLSITGAVRGDGTPLAQSGLDEAFEFTRRVYRLVGAESMLKLGIADS